ncbi:amidase [Pendulispora rubella]|uniref:Amidase n=1 Tax=Pendulispora rubella TaxID=2741070 RepID=A0ABZ2L5T8_9BACT
MHTDPVFLSARSLLDAYRSGALSPVEVVRAVLARIESENPRVNAFCLIAHEEALEAARASEARWCQGQPCGVLDGVPVSIKDILLTRGWPTLRGSFAVDASQPWNEDAPSVARLRAAGAIFVGKTTTPELGWKGVTDSPLTGITRNPWDASRTAGGSSGGSAAAVALGMAPLSLGTDGGGSVRIPAGFCGIFGLKPTYGRVPLYPTSPFGTLSHVGPMTRTVEDAALMMDLLSRADSRDPSALEPPHASFVESLALDPSRLRIAVSPRLGYVKNVHPDIEAAVLRAGEVFARLGAVVEQVDPGFRDPVEAFHTLWFAGAAKAVEALDPRRLDRLDPGLVEICEEGRRISAMQYLDAMAVRTALGQRMGRFHETYDVLLTPTLPIPAFEAGREAPEGAPSPRWTGWTPFTYPFNMTQQPAASIPCGRTSEGLPIGLQIVGARYADAKVLAVSRVYEQAAG